MEEGSHFKRSNAWAQFIVAGGLLAFFRFFPIPMHPKFSVCGFLWLTGRPCPLCGMTRGLSALTHGRWLEAVRFNWLSPIVLLILCAGLIRGMLQLWGREPDWSFVPEMARRNFWSAFVVTLLSYGVLRFFRLLP